MDSEGGFVNISEICTMLIPLYEENPNYAQYKSKLHYYWKRYKGLRRNFLYCNITGAVRIFWVRQGRKKTHKGHKCVPGKDQEVPRINVTQQLILSSWSRKQFMTIWGILKKPGLTEWLGRHFIYGYPIQTVVIVGGVPSIIK